MTKFAEVLQSWTWLQYHMPGAITLAEWKMLLDDDRECTIDMLKRIIDAANVGASRPGELIGTDGQIDDSATARELRGKLDIALDHRDELRIQCDANSMIIRDLKDQLAKTETDLARYKLAVAEVCGERDQAVFEMDELRVDIRELEARIALLTSSEVER
jgi:hypothetical protein